MGFQGSLGGTGFQGSAGQVGASTSSIRQAFVGNGTNTQFTVAGGYNAGQLDVFLNGVKLNSAEVTTSSGSVFTISTAPPSGAVVEALSTFGSFDSTLYVNTTANYTIAGNLTLAGITTKSYAGASDASLIFTGHNDKGGGGVGAYYNDFIRAGAGSGANGMWFRTNYAGDLQLIRSDYGADVFYVTQGGVLGVGGGSTASSNSQTDATTNYLNFNNNGSQIYDDGNFHIHARGSGSNMWINTNGGFIALGNQAVGGGSVASGIIMGSSTTVKAYLSVYGNKSYAIGAYGYLATGGSGTGSSTTAPYSLYCDNRIQASEVDATSDERAKNIQGVIPLETAVSFVKNVDGIHYTWNTDAVDHNDQGLKAGFGAQTVHKAGFDHMIGSVPNEKMKAQTDEDGWVHPEGVQLTMGYNQAIPYHHEVLKHLLEKIDMLEQEIKNLKETK